jgi:hypothetical protein
MAASRTSAPRRPAAPPHRRSTSSVSTRPIPTTAVVRCGSTSGTTGPSRRSSRARARGRTAPTSSTRHRLQRLHTALRQADELHRLLRVERHARRRSPDQPVAVDHRAGRVPQVQPGELPTFQSVTGWPQTFWLTQRVRVDRDYAVFGELSSDFTKNLTATVGGRFFRYDNSLVGEQSAFGVLNVFAGVQWAASPPRFSRTTCSTSEPRSTGSPSAQSGALH